MTDNGKTRTPGVYKKEGQERSRRHRVNVIVLSPIFTASETVKLGLPRLGNSVANPSSNINDAGICSVERLVQCVCKSSCDVGS